MRRGLVRLRRPRRPRRPRGGSQACDARGRQTGGAGSQAGGAGSSQTRGCGQAGGRTSAEGCGADRTTRSSAARRHAVPAFIATLQTAMPGAVTQISYWVGDWTVIVADDRILDVMRHLFAAPDAAFDLCSDVTATDWPPRAERFDVVYCLFSTRHRHRVRVKARARGQ